MSGTDRVSDAAPGGGPLRISRATCTLRLECPAECPATGRHEEVRAIDTRASGTGAPDAARPDAGQSAAHVDLSGAAALRSVLRIRPFRRLWLVLGVASFGDWLGLLATAIFASAQVSGSTAQGAAFGGTIAVRLLPALILGPIAGVWPTGSTAATRWSSAT